MFRNREELIALSAVSECELMRSHSGERPPSGGLLFLRCVSHQSYELGQCCVNFIAGLALACLVLLKHVGALGCFDFFSRPAIRKTAPLIEMPMCVASRGFNATLSIPWFVAVETLQREQDLAAWCRRPGSTQPSSFPWFAAVETLQREQDLTRLPPQGRLIPTESVKRIGR
jgi:hypothetical protein